MNWSYFAQYSELALGILLIGRLLSLQLHRVYRYFCIFLAADISGTLVWVIQLASRQTQFHFDYRVPWLLGRFVSWPMTLLTVYALLGAILSNLQGILKLSRRMLNWSFGIAFAIGLLTVLPEYHAAAATQPLNGALARLIETGLVLDRVVTSVALIALLCILGFLIWFPVEMSRNIRFFLIGFVIYFAFQGSFMLVPSYLSPQLRHLTNIAQSVLADVVFIYWGVFISKSGEQVSKKLSVVWSPREQDLLIDQLHAMNASLLRAARH